MKVVLTTFNAKYIHKALGLRWLYVARPKGFDVTICEYTIKEEIAFCVDKVLALNPDVIGISISIWNVEESKLFIQQLHKKNAAIRIVLGGPEVSFDNAEWFDLAIEAIIQGEGEKSFWGYLQGEPDVVGVKRQKSELVRQAKVDLTWLETLENPYLLEFDQKDMNHRYLYLETSRGCPYQCSYCLSSVDNAIRFFSLDYLNNILEELEKYNIPQVKFLDRTFNIRQDRVLAIISKLLKNPCSTTYQFEIVLDRVSEQLLEMMFQPEWMARFRYEVGIQSFYQPTLKEIGRVQDNALVKKYLRLLIEHNVVVHADLIAGLPYESYQQFQDSFEQLFELHPQELQLGILKLLKGTRMQSMADQYGLVCDKNPPYSAKQTNWLSTTELNSIELVADGVERTYNSGRMRYTIEQLAKDNYYGNAFKLFLKIGIAIGRLARPYQTKELFEEIFKELKKDIAAEYLKKLFLIDYYKNVKQRPPQLFSPMSIDEKKTVQKRILENKFLTDELLFHYTSIEKAYYNEEDVYLIVVYQKNQSRAEKYVLSINDERWRKI